MLALEHDDVVGVLWRSVLQDSLPHNKCDHNDGLMSAHAGHGQLLRGAANLTCCRYEAKLSACCVSCGVGFRGATTNNASTCAILEIMVWNGSDGFCNPSLYARSATSNKMRRKRADQRSNPVKHHKMQSKRAYTSLKMSDVSPTVYV